MCSKCISFSIFLQVSFRETLFSNKVPFDYWHRKQSGGRGEYARVIGYIEPLPAHLNTTNEWVDKTSGTGVPANFKPAIKKGFLEYCAKGKVISMVQIISLFNDSKFKIDICHEK